MKNDGTHKGTQAKGGTYHIRYQDKTQPIQLMPNSTPSLELVYFNIGGRALPIRLTFAIGNVEFKDIRLSFQEFVKAKAAGKFRNGQVPVLNVDGKQYTQSQAILKYAGKLAKLYPSEPLEVLAVDGVLNLVGDIAEPLNVSIHPERFGFGKFKDEQAKLKTRKYLNDVHLPKGLENLDNLLAENKSGYTVGAKLTIADILIYVLGARLKSGLLDGIDKELFGKYKNLEGLFQRVGKIPAVEKWLEVEAKHRS
jgi:prostaglandin-H2 D-isomerase / glutathione transferase